MVCDLRQPLLEKGDRQYAALVVKASSTRCA